MSAQGAFAFCKAARPPKLERLVFALMLAEADAAALARFAERLLVERELAALPIKAPRLHIALFRLMSCKQPVLYAAKLAGQDVAAAGLKLSFASIGSSKQNLALQSGDAALSAVQEKLGSALAKHGLRATKLPLQLSLATGLPRQAIEPIEPFPLTVTGLALLRAESDLAYDVLRRWPLNKLRPA
ncbi:MAG: hypothetical protein P4L57_01265 [Rhizomicrobium sp.]|nr:hypothetical protein [Rhizomicrobium sp.]